MTRMRHARKLRHAPAVLRRLAGATTAVVLALGGIVVTETNAAGDDTPTGPGPVWSLDFSGSSVTYDETHDPKYLFHDINRWTTLGNPTLAMADDPDDENETVLRIGGTKNYDGIQSPNELQAETKYNVSMRVRTTTQQRVQFVGKYVYQDESEGNLAMYQWIGDTNVTSDEWTTIAGTWTPDETRKRYQQESKEPDETDDPIGISIYIGTGGDGNPATFDILVDDILVTERGDEPILDVSDGDDTFVPGDTVTVTGTDFSPNEPVTLTFSQAGKDLTNFTLNDTPTNAIGAFLRNDVVLPWNVEPGELTITAESTVTAASGFSKINIAEPSLTSAKTVERNQEYIVNGRGFRAGERVSISGQSTKTVTAFADAEGGFEATLVAPNLPTENLTITAAGTSTLTATTHLKVEPAASDDAGIAVARNGITRNATLTIAGWEFPESQSITITATHADGNSATPVTLRTNADGDFEDSTLKIPDWWATDKPITITAIHYSSGITATDTIQLPKPEITLEPSSVSVGQKVTVRGTGFIANADVNLSTSTQWIGPTPADSTGQFAYELTVPDVTGSFEVQASQWSDRVTASATVQPSSDPALTATPSSMPKGTFFKLSGDRFSDTSQVSISFSPTGPTLQPLDVIGGSFEFASISTGSLDPGVYTIKAESNLGDVAHVDITVTPPDTSTLTGPDNPAVTSGVPFTVSGQNFTPKSTITLQYLFGAGKVVGSATVKVKANGSFSKEVAIPHGAVLGTEPYTLSIRAVDYAATPVTVQVTNAQVDAQEITILEPLSEPITPGDPISLTWENLVPGNITVDMSATQGTSTIDMDQTLLATGGNGSGTVTIPDGNLTGDQPWSVTITAWQGSARAELKVTVQNYFNDYKTALEAAQHLIWLRNSGAFPGTVVSWGELDRLVVANDFIQAGGNATQAIANHVEAQLRDAAQEVAEAILTSTLGTAADALAEYQSAATSNPALTEVLAGSARDLVDALLAQSEAALVHTFDEDITESTKLFDYDFEDDTWKDGEYPWDVEFRPITNPDPPGGTGSVLEVERDADWAGLDLEASMFSPGDVCTFEADVGYGESEPEQMDIRFLAHHSNGQYQWLGNTYVPTGSWVHIATQWTIPGGGVDYIRLVAGDGLNRKLNEQGELISHDWHTFYADNVQVSCTTVIEKGAEKMTAPADLAVLDGDLRAAVAALIEALALNTDGQKPWSAPSGVEPGWVYNEGALFTDGAIARWIGGNLYIRGESSELEGATVVVNDLDQHKSKRTGEDDVEWNGFNYGQVTIGSHIDNGANGLALAVCGNAESHGTPMNVNGMYVQPTGYSLKGQWVQDGGAQYEKYCTQDTVDSMFDDIANLSAWLGVRSYNDGEIGTDVNQDRLVEPEDGTLRLTAGEAHLDKDGLYVFTVYGTDLNKVKTLVIDGLQTSDPNEPGHILSMKPAVINVIGAGTVDWNIQEIRVADTTIGYDLVYANGSNSWHKDLGVVASALMWNFPQATDDRGPKSAETNTEPKPNTDPSEVKPLEGDEAGNELLYGGVTPSVTIRTDGIGLNFLGSLLVPYGSLKTVNVSLNGRQYVGGDWIMDDIYGWTVAKGEDGDCPIYFQQGGFPDASNNVCTNMTQTGSLLGHAEGHNYPWWFSPVTASASGQITISKTVAESSLHSSDVQVHNALPAIVTVNDLYAFGDLRCMHVENIERFRVDITSDQWWVGHEDYLQVDATWWARSGDTASLTIPNVPYGAVCTITEWPGMYTLNSAVPSGIFGILWEGTKAESGVSAGDAEAPTGVPAAPEPVTLKEGWIWADPSYAYDGYTRTTFGTEEGTTASFLLTANTDTSVASVTNAVTRVGSAAISKAFTETDLGVDVPSTVEFQWTATADGYFKYGNKLVPVPGSATGVYSVAANGADTPIQICSDENPASCEQLWFPHGTEITWNEVGEPFPVGEGKVWYEWVAKFDPSNTTVVADETIPVAVTNTLTQVPLSFSVQKVVEGTGKDLIPANGQFTITYKAFQGLTWINECAKLDDACQDTLTVRANGEVVSSIQYAEGTRIELAETLPTGWGVDWGEPEFSIDGEPLTDHIILSETSKPVTVTVKNTAIAPAAFSLYKALGSFDKQDLAATVTTFRFSLLYTVKSPNGNSVTYTKEFTSNNGNDSAVQRLTNLQVGDVVAVEEDTSSFQGDKTRWKSELVTVTFWNGNTQLKSCVDRGFAPGESCEDNEFKVTASNSNLVTVRVTNASQPEPVPPTMPMTGGALAAWLAIVAGLGLGGYLSFRRGTTVRHATSRGGAMR